MLLIFDLDDTLIDTSGSIIPGVLRYAIGAMCNHGLQVRDFDQAYALLLQLDRYHLSSQKALREFIQIYQAPDRCFSIGSREVYERPYLSASIDPIEGAIELLESLAGFHTLALVTKGREEIQREKMKRANIPIELFSYLYFCAEETLSNRVKKNITS